MCTALGLAAADLERNEADTGKGANSQCRLEEFRFCRESRVEREFLETAQEADSSASCALQDMFCNFRDGEGLQAWRRVA